MIVGSAAAGLEACSLAVGEAVSELELSRVLGALPKESVLCGEAAPKDWLWRPGLGFALVGC